MEGRGGWEEVAGNGREGWKWEGRGRVWGGVGDGENSVGDWSVMGGDGGVG